MGSAHTDELPKRARNTPASLYDAVAGRIGYEGFLEQQQVSRYRDTSNTSHAAVPPDEVLFRRKTGPVRYEEDDIYSADRHLQAHQRLPESDLLKVVHAYVADYYGSVAIEGHRQDFRSMDETALLAMGILLEEAAVDILGQTGDLAFVEPSEFSPAHGMYSHKGQWRKSVLDHPNGGRGIKRGRSKSQPTHNVGVPIRNRPNT